MPVSRGYAAIKVCSGTPNSFLRRSVSPSKRGHSRAASPDSHSLHRQQNHRTRPSKSPSKCGHDPSSSSESHRHHHNVNRAFSKDEDDVYKRVLCTGKKSDHWDAGGTTKKVGGARDLALAAGVEDAYRIMIGSSGSLSQQSSEGNAGNPGNTRTAMSEEMKNWNRVDASEHGMVSNKLSA